MKLEQEGKKELVFDFHNKVYGLTKLLMQESVKMSRRRSHFLTLNEVFSTYEKK